MHVTSPVDGCFCSLIKQPDLDECGYESSGEDDDKNDCDDPAYVALTVGGGIRPTEHWGNEWSVGRKLRTWCEGRRRRRWCACGHTKDEQRGQRDQLGADCRLQHRLLCGALLIERRWFAAIAGEEADYRRGLRL